MAENMRSAIAERFEKQVIEKGAQLVEEWKHYLDAPVAPPVTDPVQRYMLARTLANTRKVLEKEAMQTTTVFGTSYVKAMLGMSRQIWPRLFGTRLVAVQALDRPTGQLFYLDLKRDDGSTLGLHASQSHANLGYSQFIASRTYADHANGEGGEIAKGMALSISSAAVEITKVKKLKVEASWELQTDLAAYHDLDAMDLLQGAAVDEIAQEIDAQILMAVRNAAIAHKTVTFGPAPANFPLDKWPARLQRAILEADRAIWMASLRRPNVMVCGVDAYTELLDLSGFTMRPNVDWESGIYGIIPVGTLNGQYEVMVSRYIPANEMLLGRKGQGFLDAGIVYSPYVALFVSDRFFDVSVQKTIQSFASRYEIFTLANTLYARIVLDENATAGIN